jgi:SnoaL-like domain
MSEAKIAELEKKIEALTKHVTRLDDVQEIRKVQHKYGYYIDKCLFLPPV